MTKLVMIGLLAIFGCSSLFLIYRWYDRLPWLEASVRVHAERGSTNCGHLTNSGDEVHPDSAAVIRCVKYAHQQHRPFFVTLSLHGIDNYYSSAIVGDSQGQAIEIFYSTGMVIRANELLRRRCEVLDQFLILSGDKGDVPQPHCNPWPPNTVERDRIFW